MYSQSQNLRIWRMQWWSLKIQESNRQVANKGLCWHWKLKIFVDTGNSNEAQISHRPTQPSTVQEWWDCSALDVVHEVNEKHCPPCASSFSTSAESLLNLVCKRNASCCIWTSQFSHISICCNWVWPEIDAREAPFKLFKEMLMFC